MLQQVVAALPRLAALLDPGVVGSELLPALGALLHQHLSWLEGALAPHLGELLRALPPAGQDMLLEVRHKMNEGGAGGVRQGGVAPSAYIQGRLGANAVQRITVVGFRHADDGG